MDVIARTWAHIGELGSQYGVSAALFAVLYVAHHPLFWGTMAWLAARARRRKPIRVQIALGVFFWIMPYAYVFAFGHGLPAWVYGMAAVLLIVGGTHLVKDVRRRIRASAAQANL